MMLSGYMKCPYCGTDTTFETVAHVAQDWEVDCRGNFLEVLNDCSMVSADPDKDNIWTCRKCGAEAIYVED